MATVETLANPESRLAKERSFYRSSNPKKSDGRRKTAAERLEEDKLKYVKSAEARKVNTARGSPSNNSDVKKSDNCGGNDDNVLSYANRKQSRLNRSNTDASMSERWRLNNATRTRSSSINENTINSVQGSHDAKPAKDELFGRNISSKDGRNTKLSSYFSKAKESLRSVTSTITSGGSGESSKTRQSRSTDARSSKYRSSSVGANSQRHLSTKLGVPTSSSFEPALSPKSQLKNARHKLKKVSHVNQNTTYSPARHRSKTYLIDPRQKSAPSQLNRIGEKLSHHSPPTVKAAKPLATIDNTVATSRLESSCTTNKMRISELSCQRQVSVNSTSQTSDILKDDNSSTKRNEENLKAQQGERNPTCDSNLPVKVTKSLSFQIKELQPPPVSSNPQFGSAPPQRRVVGRNSSEIKKNSSRVSFCEDLSGINPGSRKSIAEALEDLINRDDDIDTAYNSMSPVASLDCKLQSQAPDKVARSRSKTPESSRSRTPTCDDGISFHTADHEVASKERVESRGETDQRQIVASSSSNVIISSDLSKKENSTRLQRSVSNDDTLTSSMLAPKERKEIAPDYSLSNKTVLCNEVGGTLKSQNTSSSASTSINKPLTALTAADLKPRREVRNTASNMPALSHPAFRGFPKRHDNVAAAFQPPSSTTKQMVRMTSSHGSQSSSPQSSLKRASPYNSSLKLNRQRSKSDVSIHQNELDRFFSMMGMDDSLTSPLSSTQDTLFTTAPFGSESDFAFSTASACVRDSMEDLLEADPPVAKLTNAPSVSIVEKKARVVRWVMSINKSLPISSNSPRSSRRAPELPVIPPRPQTNARIASSAPPPIPPRGKPQHSLAVKESDV